MLEKVSADIGRLRYHIVNICLIHKAIALLEMLENVLKGSCAREKILGLLRFIEKLM